MQDRYQNFTMLISRIYRNITRLKDMEMSEIGLKGTHLTALFYLKTSRVTTAAELSKISSEDKAAISRSLDFLQKEGYIISDGGRYRQQLKLTAKGEETAQFIVEKVNGFVDMINGDMTEGERHNFYDMLVKVDDNLKKIIGGEK